MKLKETELDAECARRRELEAVLRHVRDDAKNELVAMRIQLNETKENAKAELARGWDAMRAELDDLGGGPGSEAEQEKEGGREAQESRGMAHGGGSSADCPPASPRSPEPSLVRATGPPARQACRPRLD